MPLPAFFNKTGMQYSELLFLGCALSPLILYISIVAYGDISISRNVIANTSIFWSVALIIVAAIVIAIEQKQE